MLTKIKRETFMEQWNNENRLALGFNVKDGATIKGDFIGDRIVRNWDYLNDRFGAYLYEQKNNLGEKGAFIPFEDITHYNGVKLV